MSSDRNRKSPPDEQNPESVDSKKSGLFEYLNKPITFSFRSKTAQAPEPGSGQVEAGATKPALFKRLKSRLKRTRTGLFSGLGDFLRGGKAVDDEVLEELETRLLLADIGVEVTQDVIQALTACLPRQQPVDVETLLSALHTQMLEVLAPCNQPLQLADEHKPFVLLMVGVNGAGKTTTIGKLAKRLQAEGRSVMLAAGDTFRAAAVEQLQAWGERNRIPVIAQQIGADSASVIYDAIESAKARKIDVLIADTAGRLHTQSNLMDELKKVKRVIAKIDASAPHETMLVVDAGTGQNALNQAIQFHETIGLTGITLTKLDGTAKGGIILAIAKRLGLPIRFIGVGEDLEDLRAFNAEEFVSALLSDDENDAR
ncbi:MAG: signal recognition particle-docking protein FtsY [Gammaproteobacteria bacterium]|nr:signal recognition particle-docking protein FtsY [Gammaproteobacteria bacterium]MCP5425634.1 signal recognition particle-docking protein FtsY [Gammaproteobacteria bacterium]MCP5458968.1 signal recognition particle-docking protein FtsY [Gammaproteobacteria bacterium]